MTHEGPAAREYKRMQGVIDGALRDHPEIGTLIGSAREARARGDVGQSVEQWAEASWRLFLTTDAGTTLGIDACHDVIGQYISIEFDVNAEGQPQSTQGRDVRVPGDRKLWLLQSAEDVEALRRYLATDQVWIRADLVKADDWKDVTALAADQARRVLRKVRTPGRKEGWRSDKRIELINRVRANPGLSDHEIDALGVELGVWGSSSRDYVLIRDRAARMRRAAKKT